MSENDNRVQELVTQARTELGQQISEKQLVQWLMDSGEGVSMDMLVQIGTELGLDPQELRLAVTANDGTEEHKGISIGDVYELVTGRELNVDVSPLIDAANESLSSIAEQARRLQEARDELARSDLASAQRGFASEVAETIAREQRWQQQKEEKEKEASERRDQKQLELLERIADQSEADTSRERKPPGRRAYACNVWLDLMVNVKNMPVGSNNDSNELFQIWKQLYHFETRKDPEDPQKVSEPWDSFRKAVKNGDNYTPSHPKK